MADNTIDYPAYAALLADMEAKRAALDAAIGGLRQFLSLATGQDVPPSSLLNALSGERSGEPVEIKFDTFFGMSIPDAIRKYLAMRKQPRSVSEITTAVKEGGLPTTAKSLINSIGSTLSRMKSDGEVVQVHGKWGLKEWYPGWKEAATKSPPKGRKGRSRRSAARKVETTPTAQEKPASSKPTPEQIERIKKMDAAGKKPGEIAKEVGLHHFTVMGVLKTKKAA